MTWLTCASTLPGRFGPFAGSTAEAAAAGQPNYPGVESASVPPASYPNFAGKHAEDAMFSAADFTAYLRQTGALEHGPAPAGVIICYQRSLYDHVLRAD